jgi:hypothetical protein
MLSDDESSKRKVYESVVRWERSTGSNLIVDVVAAVPPSGLIGELTGEFGVAARE